MVQELGAALRDSAAHLAGKLELVSSHLMNLVIDNCCRVCGQGSSYCSGPDCQYLYGPACDANTVPAGDSTSGISRTSLGSVPYGTRINSCSKANVIALTFDDGPFSYTQALLDLLDQYNAKATFFISRLSRD